jgi:hypothetical protein
MVMMTVMMIAAGASRQHREHSFLHTLCCEWVVAPFLGDPE